MKQLILDHTPFCMRAALMDNGELTEFSVEKKGSSGIVGNIYKGKVENVLDGMKAAFVNIGLERNGFLYVGDSLVDKSQLQTVMPKKQTKVSPGDIIMCQVVKDQFGNKGARLTTDVTIAGFYLVFIPDSDFIGVSRKIENDKRREYLEQLVKSICPKGSGFIIRSAAEKATDEEIKFDAQNLINMWNRVQEEYAVTPEKSLIFEEAKLFDRALRDSFSEDYDKIIVNNEQIAKQIAGHFPGVPVEFYSGKRNIMSHYGVSEQINHLCERKVQMSNGAYIVIDKTEACTVIDVNTGKFVGVSDLEDTVFKTNLAAADCIAKELRLRNISGIVVIDFIDMSNEEHKAAVLERLKSALKKDRLKTTTVGMTPLGLVELTRKKTRLPLDDFMLKPCDNCPGGFVPSDEQLAFMLRDAFIDYTIASGNDIVYVGVYPALYDFILTSQILRDYIKSEWKDKSIYLYKVNNLRGDRFLLSHKAPISPDDDVVRLSGEEESEEN